MRVIAKLLTLQLMTSDLHAFAWQCPSDISGSLTTDFDYQQVIVRLTSCVVLSADRVLLNQLQVTTECYKRLRGPAEARRL